MNPFLQCPLGTKKKKFVVVVHNKHFLTYLSRVSSPEDVLGPDSLFNAVHFLLVAFAVPHGGLLGVSKGSFQSFHSLCCGPQTFLQLGQLTAKVSIVPHQLEDTKDKFTEPFLSESLSLG